MNLKLSIYCIFFVALSLFQIANAQWQSEIIDWPSDKHDVGECCSVAIDSNGFAHVIYYFNQGSYGHPKLSHAWQNMNGWNYEIIEIGDKVEMTSRTSIAIGTNGEIYIAA